MNYPERSLDDWLSALTAAGIEMERTGAAGYNGPCPLCRGTDRFYLTDRGDKVLVGCRGCLDGQPDRNTRFGELMRTVFPGDSAAGRGSSDGRRRPANDRFPAPSSTPAHTKKDRQAMAYAGRLWAAGIPADDTPGRVYLARRWVWPGLDVDGAPPLPADVVRWLSLKAAKATLDPTGKPLCLPKSVAGALMFAFTDAAGNVVAVQLEALTAEGERTPWTNWEGKRQDRYRPIRGRLAGAYMRLSRGGRESILVIVEGPADALAARWLWPDAAAVWSCSGTSGLKQVEPEDVAGFDTVTLAADGDAAGQAAMWKSAERLFSAGVSVGTWKSGPDADPADRLAERLAESAGKLEYDGERPRREAEAAAWGIICKLGNRNLTHG